MIPKILLQKRKALSCFILLVLGFGCSSKSNVIYYSFADKAIISCENGVLRYLEINVDNDIFICKRDGSKGPGKNRFHLPLMNKEFQVIFYGKELKEPVRILPNKKYIIKNYSNGDMTMMSIELETDSAGDVIKANKVDCR